MAFGNGPRIVTDGLILALDMNDKNSYPGSGATWRDISGFGRTATIAGTVITGSAFGGYVETPASQTSTYIILPESAPQSLSSGLVFTIEIWCTMKDTGATRYLCSMVNSGGANLFIIQKNPGDFGIYAVSLVSGTAPTYTVDIPQQLVVTSDGTNQFFYKNGVLTSTWGAPLSEIATTCGWVIDQEQDACKGAFDPGQNTYGWWHNVKMYNRCITAIEVAQNYNAQKSRFGL